METVIETVQFRLTAGTTEQDVIAAAKQSQTFVKNLPGFLIAHSVTKRRTMCGQTSFTGVQWTMQNRRENRLSKPLNFSLCYQ